MEVSIYGSLAWIIFLGAVAQWVGWRLKIPAILLLLGTGFLVGPVTGWINPDDVLGDILFPIISAAVAIILFEGGLTLKFSDLREAGVTIVRLVSLGVAMTWGLTFVLVKIFLGFDTMLSALFAALLVVTGPTVIGPMLRTIRPRGKVKYMAKWEGILNDPIGVVLAVLMFEVLIAQHGGGHGHGHGDMGGGSIVAIGLLKTIVIGVVFSALSGGLLLGLVKLKLLPEFLHNFVVLALVLGSFGVSNHLQEESGLLTVTLLGILLANQKLFDVRHITAFKENLQILLISMLFILLAARVSPETVERISINSVLFVVALIVLVRPAAILVSTIGSGTTWKERVLLMMLAPRGIVAVALTSLFSLKLADAGIADADKMMAVMLLVVVMTVGFYGLLAAPLSAKLGLSNLDPQGVLFIGAHDWSINMAAELKKAGGDVVLIDSNRFHVHRARRQELNAHPGNVFSEEFLEELDFSNIGHAVALTANDEVNGFAQTTLREYIERADIYHLLPEKNSNPQGGESRKMNPLFAEDATFSFFEAQMANGATFEHLTLRENFDMSAFDEEYGARAVLLFCIDPEGDVRIFSAKSKITPKEGSTLVFLKRAPDGE
ncbi:cation:proton antiporter [Cerasicoccus fimbriatus]|uniref:cation:proton antiporter n=1 Tax=Cerasicoccus fimbriatus TaxID=3014554 RepID=UPI0022B4E49E|nr:sodium:proton antiporter [Cerasicoccus sp. TK19100]